MRREKGCSGEVQVRLTHVTLPYPLLSSTPQSSQVYPYSERETGHVQQEPESMKTVLMPEGQDILCLSALSTPTGPTLLCSQISPRLAKGRQQVSPTVGSASVSPPLS